MATAPWPPQPGYTYRFRFSKNWHEAKLDRVDAQDPACVLYAFGNISVQLEMIEKPTISGGRATSGDPSAQ